MLRIGVPKTVNQQSKSPKDITTVKHQIKTVREESKYVFIINECDTDKRRLIKHLWQ